MKKALIIGLCTFLSGTSFSQVYVKDSLLSCHLIGASYAVQLPGADMAARFGFNSNTSLSYLYKTKKNWLYGADLSYIFGNRLREKGVLDSIKTADGHVINQNGIYADVRLFERGYTASLKFGKVIPKLGPNRNSGIFCLGSIGFMQHKIRIDDIGNASPQLTKEMKKGYDRLTNGIALSEFIGYLYLGNKRTVNFFAGLEFWQGFTQGRRAWNYDLMATDNSKRLDLLYGLRFGWILPIYKRNSNQFYYY
jgi:hypothetical protein